MACYHVYSSRTVIPLCLVCIFPALAGVTQNKLSDCQRRQRQCHWPQGRRGLKHFRHKKRVYRLASSNGRKLFFVPF
nr:MAG TPA: hypothetical protein [Caudoviricetes sp.]